MSIYQPYTYLIGWIQSNTWYYGCEYASVTKTANPQNLWTTYFTSSANVAAYRAAHGEPDVIEIRCVKDKASTVLDLERRVLRKFNAASANNWLNGHNGSDTFTGQIDFSKFSSEERREMFGSSRGKKWFRNDAMNYYGIPGTEPEGYRLGRITNWRAGSGWNKGATKYSDERVAALGKKISETIASKGGMRPWNEGVKGYKNKRKSLISM